MRICIVSSCGGHLTEVRCLKEIYDDYKHFYILNDLTLLPEDMKERTFFITHSERDWKFFKNLWEVFIIFLREKPDLMLSTGAGPAVPAAIIGRLFFGVHVVFIESITRIYKPSLTGRLMYFLANDFFYQWKTLEEFFPKAKYDGTLI